MFDPIRVDSIPSLRTPSLDRAPGRPVAEQLRDLLKAMAGMESTRTLAGGRRVRRYRDADYNYVEATLPELDGLEADICIHEGRVYVRIAR